VLVALSGGPDSVALVYLLRELETAGELSLAGLAHFNHQLRGEDAELDERFCRDMAERLALPVEVGRGDVRAIARARRQSIEDAGRTVRYAFLEEAAARLPADVVAVGHSRDDQAETFLLRLVRGAGPLGLAGIFPRKGRIVRPLLEVRRAELRAYASEHLLAFREDATNDDLGIPRNRVRHELIPYLERNFSASIVDVLAREADIARADDDLLTAKAVDLLGSVVLREAEKRDRIELDAEALRSLHPALGSRVARQLLARVSPGRFAGFDHVQRLLALAEAKSDRDSASLPGVTARAHEGRIVLGPAPAAPFSNSFRFPLSIPGEVLLDGPGWAVAAHELAGDSADNVSGSPAIRERPGAGVSPRAGTRGGRREGTLLTVAVSCQALRLPLAVRSRRPGDRLRPAGMGGRAKKLQDFLVDRKVAREARDLLPLVVDADDRIVWVVGYPVTEDFRVTSPSQGVIFLKARRLGGPG
jgi:tRNA(Ile)-lysidine synthase